MDRFLTIWKVIREIFLMIFVILGILCMLIFLYAVLSFNEWQPSIPYGQEQTTPTPIQRSQ